MILLPLFLSHALVSDMELKKLHMGTMSYASDSMDEIRLHLKTAFESKSGMYKLLHKQGHELSI